MGFTSPGLWLVLENELLQWPHGLVPMGRKRDLKNVYPKRPPALTPDDPEDLNEWGEELRRMTEKRRRTHEQRKPGKESRED